MSELAEPDLSFYTSQRSNESDKSLAIRFFIDAVRNEEKSVKEGRPIYDDTEMIEIRVRGDRNNIVIRPVRPQDTTRFRDAYRNWKDEVGKMESGTPLSQWVAVTRSEVEELKYLGFYTVEHLAEASEASLTKVPRLRILKDRANMFLEAAKGEAPIAALQTTVDELKAQVAAQAEMIQRYEDALKQESNGKAVQRK